ncbi:MAG: Sec-independent protein translocase protein TatB [Burkholderiales bacterium]
MFDIGFSEFIVIGIVALVVLGPEKLPRVAKTVGHLMGRMQRYVNDVKADINREMELDELRRFKQEIEKTATTFESSIRDEVGKAQSAVSSVTGDFTSGVSSAAADVNAAVAQISGSAEAAVSSASTTPPAVSPPRAS